MVSSTLPSWRCLVDWLAIMFSWFDQHPPIPLFAWLTGPRQPSHSHWFSLLGMRTRCLLCCSVVVSTFQSWGQPLWHRLLWLRNSTFSSKCPLDHLLRSWLLLHKRLPGPVTCSVPEFVYVRLIYIFIPWWLIDWFLMSFFVLFVSVYLACYIIHVVTCSTWPVTPLSHTFISPFVWLLHSWLFSLARQGKTANPKVTRRCSPWFLWHLSAQHNKNNQAFRTGWPLPVHANERESRRSWELTHWIDAGGAVGQRSNATSSQAQWKPQHRECICKNEPSCACHRRARSACSASKRVGDGTCTQRTQDGARSSWLSWPKYRRARNRRLERLSHWSHVQCRWSESHRSKAVAHDTRTWSQYVLAHPHRLFG